MSMRGRSDCFELDFMSFFRDESESPEGRESESEGDYNEYRGRSTASERRKTSEPRPSRMSLVRRIDGQQWTKTENWESIQAGSY